MGWEAKSEIQSKAHLRKLAEGGKERRRTRSVKLRVASRTVKSLSPPPFAENIFSTFFSALAIFREKSECPPVVIFCKIADFLSSAEARERKRRRKSNGNEEAEEEEGGGLSRDGEKEGWKRETETEVGEEDEERGDGSVFWDRKKKGKKRKEDPDFGIRQHRLTGARNLICQVRLRKVGKSGFPMQRERKREKRETGGGRGSGGRDSGAEGGGGNEVSGSHHADGERRRGKKGRKQSLS